MGDDALEVGLRKKVEASVPESEPFAPDLHLFQRLLPGDIQDLLSLNGEITAHLEKQGGFADPGFSPDQDQRTQYDPSTKYGIQLIDAGLDSFFLSFLDIFVENRVRRRK